MFFLKLYYGCRALTMRFRHRLDMCCLHAKHFIGMQALEFYYGLRIIKNVFRIQYRQNNGSNCAKN